MSGNASVINIEVVVDDKGSKKIKRVKDNVENVGKTAKAADTTFQSAGKTLVDFNRQAVEAQQEIIDMIGKFNLFKATVITVVAVVMYQFARLSAAAIQAASDLEEVSSKFETVFTGWNTLADGEKFLIDKGCFDLIVSHMKERGIELVFDYEHQTLEGVEAPAAGWVKELSYDDEKGIIAHMDWTEKAQQYIANREYRYFSPVFCVRKSDSRVIELHSVALTNSPRINNLEPIIAKLNFSDDSAAQPITQGETMDWKKLIAKLGLKEDATEEEVMAAVEALTAKAETKTEVVAKDIYEALDLSGTEDVSTVVATINAEKQKSKGMVSREEFEKLQKTLLDNEVSEVVAKAMTDGKVTPDQKDWATSYATKDLEGFKTFITKAPVVVPVDDLPGKKETGEKGFDETTLEVAKQMGLSQEDLTKYA